MGAATLVVFLAFFGWLTLAPLVAHWRDGEDS